MYRFDSNFYLPQKLLLQSDSELDTGRKMLSDYSIKIVHTIALKNLLSTNTMGETCGAGRNRGDGPGGERNGKGMERVG